MTSDTTLTFTNPPGGGFSQQPVPQAPAGFEISEGNRKTLKRVLNVIKASRAKMKNIDPRVAGPARARLIIALNYIAGFLDGKGAGKAALHPGFVSAFESQLSPLDPEAQLDNLEKSLENLIGPTREILMAIIGVELIAIGVALRVIGSLLE